jgi:ABC-type uncharacterized transport system permease subunit
MTMWVAMAFYAGATVLYAYFFLEKRRAFSWLATFFTGAGFLCHTASIGLASTVTHGTKMTGANSLVLAAWALVLVYFVVEHLVRVKVYGAVLIPLGLATLLTAQLIGLSGVTETLTPEELGWLANWRVGFHVLLIVFANAGFAINAAASLTYLALEAQLKRHRTTRLFKRLPSLPQTDLVARRAVTWAFPAYSAGLLLGIVRAIETDVTGWFADLRVILAAAVWLVYATYLYLHYGRGVSGRTTAWVALLGILLVIAIAVTARLLPVGFHVFGVAG